MTKPKDWKNRKKQKPKITDKKLRGEWAEMVFMTRATELGIPISKPWGEMRSYDFIVGRPRHFVSVQVKSTIYELGTGYVCAIKGGHKPYPPGSFDFLAAYVVDENAWYIIPEKEFGVRDALRFIPSRKRPNTKSIARRGICWAPALRMRTRGSIFRVARKNSQRGRLSQCHRRHTPRSLAWLGMTIRSAILLVVCFGGYFLYRV
ncbi:MAG TPA: group I intron-associated PD-(D/E)XK endonuclease [Candidatus Acidoferrum sp.]|jgi:hypothetical protein|nr:group I intron-associated PD-(D/E)XK endonuclease [Candidatus Acidoferrum sp.]